MPQVKKKVTPRDLTVNVRTLRVYKLSEQLLALKSSPNTNVNKVGWDDPMTYGAAEYKGMDTIKDLEFSIGSIGFADYNAKNKYYLTIKVVGGKEDGKRPYRLQLEQKDLEHLLDDCWTGATTLTHPKSDPTKVLEKLLSQRTGLEFGSDPEIFVENGKSKIIPAWHYLPEPVKIKKMPNGHAPNTVFWDGVQAEFTTDNSRCLAWVFDSIQEGLKTTLQTAREYDKTATLSTKTVTKLTKAEMKRFDPQFLEFGCNPVHNVYGLEPVRPKDGLVEQYRPAGGHIHIGLYNGQKDVNNRHKDNIEKYVKMIDSVLGVVSVAMFYKFDKKERRELYGLAGEYRTPKHGLEYRTLSNAWLQHPVLANICFELARAAVTLVNEEIEDVWNGVPETEVIRIIQENDYVAARKVVRANKDFLQAIVGMCLMVNDDKKKKDKNMVYNIALHGAHRYLGENPSIEKAWDLEGDWRSHCDGPGKNIRLASQVFAKSGLI